MSEQQSYPYIDRHSQASPPCKHEFEIKALAQRDEALQKSMDGVSTKLDLILAQITKVAVLEEKHSNQTVDLTRAHDKIGKLEKELDEKAGSLKRELDELSKEARGFINHTNGMAKMAWLLWTCLGAGVVTLFVKVLFFASAHGMTP